MRSHPEPNPSTAAGPAREKPLMVVDQCMVKNAFAEYLSYQVRYAWSRS